jgi:hypothetical protein
MAHTVVFNPDTILISCGIGKTTFTVQAPQPVSQPDKHNSPSVLVRNIVGKSCPGCEQSLYYILFGLDD